MSVTVMLQQLTMIRAGVRSQVLGLFGGPDRQSRVRALEANLGYHGGRFTFTEP